MAFQRVPNTVEIRINYTLYGSNIQNTLHAYSSAGYDQAAASYLAAYVDSNLVPALLADLSVHIEYVSTDVVGLDQEYDVTASAYAFADNGDVNDASMPPQIAFCVAKLSGYSGRASRGRVYVAGIPKSYMQIGANTGNLISTAARAAYVGHIDGWRSSIETVGIWDAVIVSRYHNGSKRSEGITTHWLTTSSNSSKVATMRGRAE